MLRPKGRCEELTWGRAVARPKGSCAQLTWGAPSRAPKPVGHHGAPPVLSPPWLGGQLTGQPHWHAANRVFTMAAGQLRTPPQWRASNRLRAMARTPEVGCHGLAHCFPAVQRHSGRAL
jgi:hypothetical protein